MDVIDILSLTIVIISIVLVLLNAYYFLLFKRNKPTFALRQSKMRRAMPFANGILGVGLLGILTYLFILPANIQSVSIKNNEPWTDYSKPFEVVFDKPVKQSSTYGFSKEIKGEWKWEKQTQFDIFNRKLVFYPTETLLPDEKVSFDSSFKPLAGFSATEYKTEFLSGISNPKVEVNDEISDKQNVNPKQNITVLVPGANPNSYILDFESTPKVDFKQSKLDGSKIQIDHETPFTNNESYEVKIFLTPVTYNIKSGEVITKGQKREEKMLKFQVAPSPNIKDVTPKGTNALANEEIAIEFDQEMNKETVEKGISFVPEIKGTFTWNEESTRVTFKPSELLKKETNYTIKLGKDIESKFGAKFVQELPNVTPVAKQLDYTFKTIGSVGVAKTTPGNGSRDLAINTSFTITFTQAVDKASAESKITVNPAVAGKYSWNGNTVTFKPDGNLKYSQKYTVTVAAGVKSIDGLDFKSNYTFNFTTKANRVVLNVPIISQTHQFSCNVTAASIALKYRGINVSQDQVYASLPKQSVPKENGFWGNPNLGYVGNIDGNSNTGYGVHWGPIANYISRYRPASVKTGWNTTGLLQEIDAGNPVIIWWQNGHAAPTRLSWKSYDASGNVVTINGVNGMHSEVVVGYVGSPENPTQIILSDPWNNRWGGGYHYVSADRFRQLWGYFGNTGIVVR